MLRLAPRPASVTCFPLERTDFAGHSHCYVIYRLEVKLVCGRNQGTRRASRSLMDWQTLLQLLISGLTIGCIYSLVGLGFALTLRATELFNFAHGEMVMLGAMIGYSALTFLHVSFLGAFVIVTICLALIGILIERFILRPMLRKKAPLLNLLIATLGISVMLQALAIILWGREPLKYPTALSGTLVVGHVQIQQLNLWIMVLSAILMIALQWFLTKTRLGIAWRAASLDPQTAQLYGVNRNVNVALTFGISAGLGGAAGVLIAPLYFASFGLGEAVLLKAFAAAAIGGFGIVGTVAGGLVVGALETFGAGLISSEYKNVILYGLLLVILMLFFKPQSLQGRSASQGVVGLGKKELCMVMARWPGWVKPALIVGVIALWGGSALGFGPYALRILNIAMLFAIAALGLQLIIGYTGIFSFGHAALFGVGAYVYAVVSTKWGIGFPIAVLSAICVTMLVALLIVPVFRLRGHYVAVSTLVIGEIIVILIMNWKAVTNGAYGVFGIPAAKIGPWTIQTDRGFFIFGSLVLAVVVWGLRRLVSSRLGQGMRAVRTNELAAAAFGISAFRMRVLAFVMGAACAGLSGALYASYVSYINPQYFGFEASVMMVVMVVIGGLGSLAGAVVGAAFVILLPEVLRGLSDYRLVLYGALIVGFMVALPGGLADLGGRAVRLLRPARRAS